MFIYISTYKTRCICKCIHVNLYTKAMCILLWQQPWFTQEHLASIGTCCYNLDNLPNSHLPSHSVVTFQISSYFAAQIDLELTWRPTLIQCQAETGTVPSRHPRALPTHPAGPQPDPHRAESPPHTLNFCPTDFHEDIGMKVQRYQNGLLEMYSQEACDRMAWFLKGDKLPTDYYQWQAHSNN